MSQPNNPDIDINNPSTIVVRLQLVNQVLKNVETELTLITYEILKQQQARNRQQQAGQGGGSGATAQVVAGPPPS